MTTRTRLYSLIAAAGIALICLTGCSVQAQDATGGADISMAEPAYPDIAALEEDHAVMSKQAVQDASQPVSPSVIQEAWLTVEVAQVEESVKAAQQLVEVLDGRVDHRSLSRSGEEQHAGHASLTLRVPEDKLDTAMNDLGELGRVLHESVNATDVTLQRTDLAARLASLERSIEQLTALLDETTTVSEVIEIETALSQRQSDLDSLIAQLDVLDDRISYATIGLEFTQQQPNIPEPQTGFWGAIQTGFWSLVAFFQAVFLGLGYALPWIGVTVIIGVIIWMIIRGRRGQKRP